MSYLIIIITIIIIIIIIIDKETDLSCSKESNYTYQLIIPSCGTIQCVLEFTPYDVSSILCTYLFIYILLHLYVLLFSGTYYYDIEY